MDDPTRKWLGRRVSLGWVPVVLVVVLWCVGVPAPDFLFHLTFGWVAFLFRVSAGVTVRWDRVGSAAVFAVLLAVGSHLFLRWLYREMRPTTGESWRGRWTLGGLAIVLLMFAAGVAMVGATHQAAWLARSPGPWYRPGGTAGDHYGCALQLRRVGQHLLDYAGRHDGKFPDGLRELAVDPDTDVDPGLFICPSTTDTRVPGQTRAAWAAGLLEPGHCSYIYFGKGLTNATGFHRVLAVEPLENHGGVGVNVLYADGHVEWVERPEAERLLIGLGFERVEPGRPPPPATRP